ncbi:MAG: hypothetical protein MZV64_14355 [Ignavibacteriales bacterium]|nr:hypothetical protein [Ignavibacteriales bacterium]
MKNLKKNFGKKQLPQLKIKRDDFIFIAETYWDLEWQLQNLGFDFTYDKRLTDRLVSRLHIEALKTILMQRKLIRKNQLDFLENHDEDRAIVKLGREKSIAAAVITSTIPGYRFLL